MEISLKDLELAMFYNGGTDFVRTLKDSDVLYLVDLAMELDVIDLKNKMLNVLYNEMEYRTSSKNSKYVYDKEYITCFKKQMVKLKEFYNDNVSEKIEVEEKTVYKFNPKKQYEVLKDTLSKYKDEPENKKIIVSLLNDFALNETTKFLINNESLKEEETAKLILNEKKLRLKK